MQLLFTSVLSIASLISCHVQRTSGLWPMPRFLETGQTPLSLSWEFAIEAHVEDVPPDLKEAILRTLYHLKNDKLERLTVGRGSDDVLLLGSASQLRSLELILSDGEQARDIAFEATLPLGTRREEYKLTVPADGSPATLSANSTLGLFRGLTTFEQLWYTTSSTMYTLEAPIAIEDAPAFPYRGLLLDTSRNFFPVADIKRTLDAMSWVKINQFHWHVVDSHSFPLEISGFSEIAQRGAYSTSSIYRPEDVQDIISYAGARGIDVLIEIDVPGHQAAIHESHPEHITCYGKQPNWFSWAAEPPAGQLRFVSPATRNFTAELLKAAAKMVPSLLFSTGGDELNARCYEEDAETQRILKSTGQTAEQALETFVETIHGGLRDAGKTPVVWEDLVLRHNFVIPSDTVVMIWSSSRGAASVAAKNYSLVHSASDYFYLDCGAGEWTWTNSVSWCEPFKTWQKSYTFDPYANLEESQRHLVLGGQQSLWSEQSGPENLDSILWPRAASSAEVFWTGATLPDGTARNLSAALPRLHDLRFRMVQRGVKAIPLQPLWCALRPGSCDPSH